MSLTRGRELPIGARAGLIDPKHVRAMGSARWLYDWILWRVTSEQDGVGRVLGGSPVRCEEIAADLGVGLRTIYRWMDRLRGPYIRTRHVVVHGHHGLAIEVLKSKKFRPVRPPEISRISTASTANPAKPGRCNPASFGRDNPAKVGRFHKEYRKPFTESYGKCDSECLGDLDERSSEPKAKASSPPVSENEKAKQFSHPGEIGARDACVEKNAEGGRGDNAGRRNGGERELIEELRHHLGRPFGQMAGGKSLPRQWDPARREMLERQRRELLQRVGERSLPP